MRRSWNEPAAWRRAAPLAMLLVLGCMAWGLRVQGPTLLRAAGQLEAGALALSGLLCLAHRLLNARGWAFLLGALGCPIDAGLGARIWLASESGRWVPGSVWSYGSRAVLASRRGVPADRAAASLVWELLLTLAAWVLVAAVFAPRLAASPPGLGGPSWRSEGSSWLAATAALCVAGLFGLALRRVAAVRSLAGRLRSIRPDLGKLSGVLAFYTSMSVLNGVALVPLVRALPGGDECPIAAIIGANAAAWLLGFLTPIAPGGLVVREALLSSLLTPWLSTENALIAALAWRLVQVLTELLTFAWVGARGLDGGHGHASAAATIDQGS